MIIHRTGPRLRSHSVGRSASAPDLSIHQWLPLPRRHGIAICLSGGGFRAAVFHLGALRRLNELGILTKARTVTASSGGSIVAAMVAAHMAATTSSRTPSEGEGVLPDWEKGVAEPLWQLVSTNIRDHTLLAWLKSLVRLGRSTPNAPLVARFATGISPMALIDGPIRPRFSFVATDLTYGVPWICETGAGQVGDDVVGFAQPPPVEWTIARAVAASCSVPGLFAAIRASADQRIFSGGVRHLLSDGGSPVVELVDGGVVDNLGLGQAWRDHELLLVSDAAITLAPGPRRGWGWRFLRYPIALLEQATNARRQWLVSNLINGALGGAYWSINGRTSDDDAHSVEEPQEALGYSRRLINDVISQIRIDLDALADSEFAVLENLGYLMADHAVRRLPDGIAAPDTPAPSVPHPRWMEESSVRRALAESGRIRLRGRSR